jgi:hypothetical protein
VFNLTEEGVWGIIYGRAKDFAGTGRELMDNHLFVDNEDFYDEVCFIQV